MSSLEPPSGSLATPPAAKPKRRKLLATFAMLGSLAISYGSAFAFAARYLYPKKRPPRWRSIFVARESALKQGEPHIVSDLRGVPVQVIKDGKDLRALSTVCPHLGCRVRWEPQDQQFKCPCHTAAFDREGKVLSGPPPRPLDRYEVELIDGSVYLKTQEPA